MAPGDDSPRRVACFYDPDPSHLLLTREGCDVSEARDLGFQFVPQTLDHQRICHPAPKWASALPPLHQTIGDPPFHQEMRRMWLALEDWWMVGPGCDE
jgi:hypothetical protein